MLDKLGGIMKLKTKLLFNSLASIFVALLILTYVIVRMIGMQQTANHFSNTLLQVEQLNSAVVSYQQALDNFGKNSTAGNLVNVQTKYQDMLNKTYFLLHISYNNEEEKKRINFIRNKIKTIKKDTEVVIEEENSVKAKMLSSKIFGVMNDIYLLNLSLNQQYDLFSKENNNQILYISIMSGVILLFVSSMINLIITRKIVKPIKLLNNYSKNIASGNLSVHEIQVNSNDEVGELTRSFNFMKGNLRELIDKIKKNAAELREKNERINDSIIYAKRLQDSIFAPESQLQQLFSEYFLIFKQRDTVGGDFFWCKHAEKGFYIAVADCTGHGVPGALMTTLSISALNQIIEEDRNISPSAVLESLNHKIKKALNQEVKEGLTDDGLDIALCYIEGNKVTYAGAKVALYVSDHTGVTVLKEDRKSIGYRRTPLNYRFTEQSFTTTESTTLYLTTDGFIDQNGCENDQSFGKKRFVELIEINQTSSLNEQKDRFHSELKQFMGKEAQRDDITVLAFKL